MSHTAVYAVGRNVMNPWLGRVEFLVGLIAMIAIRIPYGKRCAELEVVESQKGPREIALLALMWIATTILPLISIVTPLLSFADYPLHPIPFSLGTACLLSGLWLFRRSHVDLGDNWSISLEIRTQHKLIDHGVYARVRHPMYTSIFLQAIAQALLLPNWLAGPSCLLAFILMFALRVSTEERMMLKQFGADYALYMGRSKRLVPGVW